MEVIISLLITLSLISYFEMYFLQVPNQYYEARIKLAESIAEYDFMNNAVRNLTTARCLEMYLTYNSVCIRPLVHAYGLLYGIDDLNVSSEGNGGNKSYSCFPYSINSSLYTLCFEGG